MQRWRREGRGRMGWKTRPWRGGERERQREICRLHKFAVDRRRPQGEIQHDARAAECLGRSVDRRLAANRAFNVASLFALLRLLCLPPSFPPSLLSVVCCRSIGEENAHWSGERSRGRTGAVVGRTPHRPPRRPFRDLGLLGSFSPAHERHLNTNREG